jgi:hypothetical protein
VGGARGAISKHLSDRIGKALYEKEAGQIAFMTLVNLPLTLSFSEIREKFSDVLKPTEEGVFVITNPNRHRYCCAFQTIPLLL